ncbi:hypothetical protein [Baaleninema simplex]|uniref:hypothetical protein n=1 Tax=Baaleninema simplex TaxID=2862350 RepID=UPI00034B7C12|nr:hypothetical protein [Baaleninema simplex]
MPTPGSRVPDVEAPTASPRSQVEAHRRGSVEPESPAPRNADGTADISNGKPESASAREASVRESGHRESNLLSEQEIHNELEHIRNNSNILEGTPPNRTAKIGEHEWIEQPGGGWCRHSNAEICVIENRVTENFDRTRQKMYVGGNSSPVRQVGETDEAYRDRLQRLWEELENRDVKTDLEVEETLEQIANIDNRLNRLGWTRKMSEVSLAQKLKTENWTDLSTLAKGEEISPPNIKAVDPTGCISKM